MGDDSLRTEQLTVLLFGVGVAAVVVTLYHCFAACWCHRHQSRNDAAPPPATEPLHSPTSTTFDNSVAHLIPAHKYRKGTCPVVGDGTCAVCLSEFEDGEDLRTMPECSHSFHVPCIDTWLRSHPTCPVCRTDATPSPSPRPFGRVSPDYLAGGEVGALESIVVQSRYSNTAIS